MPKNSDKKVTTPTPTAMARGSDGDVTVDLGRRQTIVRIGLAAILLLAAGLKAHQLATLPVVGKGLLASRWVLIAELECELLLGLWLLSGVFLKLSWLVATGSFAAFSVITYVKAARGDASCGCFGVVAVSPWITLVMDVGAVSALIILRRGFWRPPPVARPWLRFAGTCIVAIALGVPAAAAALSFKPAKIDNAGRILGSGKYVLLEPELWTGKKLPLLSYLDMPKPDMEKIAGGEWSVILYRHDCPHCRQQLGQMRKGLKGAEPPKTAFIELPPYGTGRAEFLPEGKDLLFGKLDNSKRWLVETPVMLNLVKGVVQSVPSGAGSGGSVVIASGDANSEKVKVRGDITMQISQHKAFCDLRFAVPNSLQDVAVSVENDTKTEFRIRKAVSQCGCMKAVEPPKAIAPGQKETFRIRFHAPKDPTRYAKNIALVPADGRDPILLGIHARVGMPLTADPAVADLGTLVGGEERIVPLTIRNEMDKPVRPVYGTSSLAGCVPRVPRASAEPGGKVVIPLFLRAAGKPGSEVKGRVQIQTNCPTQPTVRCSVRYSISTQYSVSPGTVSLGSLAPGTRHKVDLRIDRSSPGDGFVAAVTPAGLENIAVDSQTVAYGPDYADVHVTVVAGQASKDITGSLKIDLSGHDQPVIVPIRGRVSSGSTVAAKSPRRTTQ